MEVAGRTPDIDEWRFFWDDCPVEDLDRAQSMPFGGRHKKAPVFVRSSLNFHGR